MRSDEIATLDSLELRAKIERQLAEIDGLAGSGQSNEDRGHEVGN